MAKTLSRFHLGTLLFHLPIRNSSSKSLSFLLSPNPKPLRPIASLNRSFSITATPYPLQYDIDRPDENPNHLPLKSNCRRLPHSKLTDHSDLNADTTETDRLPSPEHYKAFLQPGEEKLSALSKGSSKKAGWKVHATSGDSIDAGKGVGKEEDDKGLVFLDEKSGADGTRKDNVDLGNDVSQKKVEKFFKGLRKSPTSNNGDVSSSERGEPFLASRINGLPSVWDTPSGTVILINKPKRWTSFRVCSRLRSLMDVQKVGHAGTLDPMATGLLIVCLGKATKLVSRYQGMVKDYTGVFRLGEATSTLDADSPVIQGEPWEHIKDEEIKKAAASFVGEIMQIPPMFSAIRVGGERMYDKARRGISVKLDARRVSIFQFDIERSIEDRQNLIFRVVCSKGTYIRSLGADLGKALGSCAHLTALHREAIGEYKAVDAFEVEELEEQVTNYYL